MLCPCYEQINWTLTNSVLTWAKTSWWDIFWWEPVVYHECWPGELQGYNWQLPPHHESPTMCLEGPVGGSEAAMTFGGVSCQQDYAGSRDRAWCLVSININQREEAIRNSEALKQVFLQSHTAAGFPSTSGGLLLVPSLLGCWLLQMENRGV